MRAPLAYTPRHLAEKILTSRSALEGERKQVTVLFADTAGFVALARDLDPEVVHEVMDHCFGLITAEVHRCEGTINQYTGDGVMALFGAPIAHEDSPRRAVHAALGMQRAMQDFGRDLQRHRGFSIQMRIGINTGLVVVGKIGDDLRMDYTAVGDTTNLAARLQQLAEPGTVVISEATRKLVAGFFDTRDLGDRAIKGHTEPVRVYEVLRARGRRTRLAVAAERRLTPRVGRNRELTVLLDLEGAEVAQQLWPWPEPRGHSLLKVGLAHLERGAHGLAEEFSRRAWTLLEEDTWLRWRWHIPLLRAYGELALAEGRLDDAWTYAAQSLELATQTDSRKHIARAQRLQGDILAASGRLAEAAQALATSVQLAEHIQTPREAWLGQAALGRVLLRLGRDKEAEAQFTQATQTIEAIATNLRTPRLRHSFLSAAPVLGVYTALGHRPPPHL